MKADIGLRFAVRRTGSMIGTAPSGTVQIRHGPDSGKRASGSALDAILNSP